MSRQPLRRRVDRRVVAGVVGGIADWLNAPAPFLRVVLTLASVYVPWLLPAYAIAALLLPARGRRLPDWDNLVGLGRLGILFGGITILYGDISVDQLFEQSPAIWVPLTGLLLVGAVLFFARNYPEGPDPAEARATVLGALPVALFAGMVALGVVLAPDVRWEHALPAGAILAGAALLVGERLGGWRSLVMPAVAALVVAGTFAAAQVRLDGGVGDRLVTVTPAGDPPPTQRLAVGDLTLKLGRLRQRTGTVTVRASVGVGDMFVVVPRHARVALDAHVGRGEINTADHRTGYGLEVDQTSAEVVPVLNRHEPRRRLTVHLVADVGMGTLEVIRVGARPGLL